MFSSQAEAVKAAREFLFPTPESRKSAPLAALRLDPRFDTPRGYYAVYVTANVNGRDVLIEFDTFGRKQSVTVIKES